MVSPRQQLSDVEVEELLGAYALDACDPEETVAIEAVLARRPDLAREAQRLSRAASWVGAAEAVEPPGRLRRRVLSAAVAQREGEVDPVLDLYLSITDEFGRMAEALPTSEYRTVTRNGLSAHDLVVHMAAQESLLAQNLGVPTFPGSESTDIVSRTYEFLPQFADTDLDDALAVWRASVEANRAWAAAHSEQDAPWRGLPLTRDDALVVRAFEEWIHCDDLRHVVGLDPAPPHPRHLAIMAELASRLIPLTLDLAGRHRDHVTARLVLTGGGGGDWMVALGEGEVAADPHVTVTADVIDWCLLMADRLAPADLRHSVVGDTELGADIVAAAPALATL
jgi:uncharacterized protein (TIGR03083 family)